MNRICNRSDGTNIVEQIEIGRRGGVDIRQETSKSLAENLQGRNVIGTILAFLKGDIHADFSVVSNLVRLQRTSQQNTLNISNELTIGPDFLREVLNIFRKLVSEGDFEISGIDGRVLIDILGQTETEVGFASYYQVWEKLLVEGKIKRISKLKSYICDAIRTGKPELDLNFVDAINIEEARIISGFRGECINLDGVRKIGIPELKELSKFRGKTIKLNSLQDISLEMYTIFKDSGIEKVELNGIALSLGNLRLLIQNPDVMSIFIVPHFIREAVLSVKGEEGIDIEELLRSFLRAEEDIESQNTDLATEEDIENQNEGLEIGSDKENKIHIFNNMLYNYNLIKYKQEENLLNTLSDKKYSMSIYDLEIYINSCRSSGLDSLDLDSLEVLGEEEALILSMLNFKSIHLNGLKSISPNCLRILSNFTGRIYLGGVEILSKELLENALLGQFELMYIGGLLIYNYKHLGNFKSIGALNIPQGKFKEMDSIIGNHISGIDIRLELGDSNIRETSYGSVAYIRNINLLPRTYIDYLFEILLRGNYRIFYGSNDPVKLDNLSYGGKILDFELVNSIEISNNGKISNYYVFGQIVINIKIIENLIYKTKIEEKIFYIKK